MLALSFLLLIGLSLIAEGFGYHIPKGYIYFAMGFSVFVEMINLRLRASRLRCTCGRRTSRTVKRPADLRRLRPIPGIGVRARGDC